MSLTDMFGGRMDAPRLERAQRFPLFRDGKFHNSHPTEHQRSGSIASASFSVLTGARRRRPPGPLPAADGAARLVGAPTTGLRLTWIGHSTVLLEIDGVRLLTDPHYSERASPFTFAGPRRFQPPAVPMTALGHIDAVLLSHDHYDHLDMATVRALARTGTRFLAPLGVGPHLQRWGIASFTELVWWDEVEISGLRIVATPAQHFSGRSFSARNSTLWTSYSIIGPVHRAFFSGDTGLSPDFEVIGQKLGPFDVALFEIGACHPAWADIHLGPTRAVTAAGMVRARRLLPIHWGTFDLATHGWDEPAEEVLVAAPAAGVPLILPQLGDPVEPDLAAAPTAWWRTRL